MNNDDVDAILDIPRPTDINDRQWAFIHAVSRPESTGKSAAIEAGYSVESAESKASQLLAIGKIRQAVDEIRRQYRQRAVAATLAHQTPLQPSFLYSSHHLMNHSQTAR